MGDIFGGLGGAMLATAVITSWLTVYFALGVRLWRRR